MILKHADHLVDWDDPDNSDNCLSFHTTFKQTKTQNVCI